MAADVLSHHGLNVVVHDHMPSPARKFLLAGRGGLNLTHSEDLELLLSRYGDGRARLEQAIRAFPPQQVRQWADALGAATFVGSSGRVFPRAMKASPLLRAWLRSLGSRGVRFVPHSPWPGFGSAYGICAFGGASWPQLGSTAAWVQMFRDAGIEVSDFTPSNGRLLVEWSPHMLRHAGAPLKNIALSCGEAASRGEAVISRQGIEGGAVYALSAAVRQKRGSPLLLDLKPALSDDQVAQRLARPRGKQSLSNHLRKSLGLSPAAIALLREGGGLDPKRVPVAIKGFAGLDRAISSAGGVTWSQLDNEFGLVRRPGWFLAGEMLDWDAPTGGYLLQACLSTGVAAARGLLRHLGKLPLERHIPG